MAIDQKPAQPTKEMVELPAIENEFPAYRAISATAVLSLVFGIASVFCYADLWFLLVSAVAVIFGLVSLRNIRRLPDVLTGAACARLGIGIALLFGLTALTRTASQEILVTMDASQFAKKYLEVIQNEPVASALWWQQSPEFRSTKSPEEVAAEVKKARPPGTPDLLDEKSQTIQAIKDRLKQEGQHIHFSKIESKDINGLTTYANALFDIDGPATKDFPAEQFVLVQMTKGPDAGKSDWIVQEVKFPYVPASVSATAPKKIDDGHGH